MIERTNSRGHWPTAAGFNHGFDRCTRTSEHCLNGTIAAIAYPTMQSALVRLLLDKGAIADTLNPPAHDNVAGDRAAHAGPPASKTRAPVQRDADQRSTERMWGSGNFHPRAADAIISTYPGLGLPMARRRRR